MEEFWQFVAAELQNAVKYIAQEISKNVDQQMPDPPLHRVFAPAVAMLLRVFSIMGMFDTDAELYQKGPRLRLELIERLRFVSCSKFCLFNCPNCRPFLSL